jgi:hypothetical protein
MRRIRAERTIAAPASVVWRLLVDPALWSSWGPSIRRVSVDADRLAPGVTGTVDTVAHVSLPFEITEFVDGVRWGWTVAGIEATDHTVDPLGDDRCRVSFGVPWIVAPYLAVCHLALARIEALAVAA